MVRWWQLSATVGEVVREQLRQVPTENVERFLFPSVGVFVCGAERGRSRSCNARPILILGAGSNGPSRRGSCMSVETAVWKLTQEGPLQMSFVPLELESALEDMVVADPAMIGAYLMVIGRQIATGFGGYVDTLGLDVDAQIHVIELKRDRTPREVVAQVLDYGSWATGLALEDVAALYAEHNEDGELESDFAERFSKPLPDVFNPDQQLTIVASELDPASDRIVEYLAEGFGVPINAVFFRYFEDGGNRYLTRTWLLSPEEAAASGSVAKRRRGKVRRWNGRDFYVVQGRAGDASNRWDVARRYGVVSAGGGSWYWKPLRNLKPGKRVFAYVGGVGYVGVGKVAGEMVPAREFKIEADGVVSSLVQAPDLSEAFLARAVSEDEETTEMVVPVEWQVAVPLESAVKEPGLFASQVTVCRLRDERTIEVVSEQLGLADDDSESP